MPYPTSTTKVCHEAIGLLLLGRAGYALVYRQTETYLVVRRVVRMFDPRGYERGTTVQVMVVTVVTTVVVSRAGRYHTHHALDNDGWLRRGAFFR